MSATPEGCRWRPSQLPHLRRVEILERGAEHIGSIGPKGRKWVNRDTGEEFGTKAEARADVEKYANARK